MRRALTFTLALSALPLLAACVEDPEGSGCVWSVQSDRLVLWDSDIDPFGQYCYDQRYGTTTTASLPSATTTTVPAATTTTVPADTTTTSTAPVGGFTASAVCVPGTPSRVAFSGVGPVGSQVTFSNASPYVWVYTLPGPTTVGTGGAWSRDINFEPGSTALFPFTVTVTNSVAGALTVTVPSGC